MRPISSSSGSISRIETPGEAGDFTDSTSGKEYYQELIARANTVPLIRVFKHYGLRINELNKKTTCPFKSHKGGRENTPSFYFYSETNSFCCYGCNTGGKHSHSCEFMAAMDGITRVKAAYKIIEQFGSDVDGDIIIDAQNFPERLEIMMDFSNTVREFRQMYLDEKSQEFIEYVCSVYDQHNMKRDLDNEALRSMVDQIKNKINTYQGSK